ncbi:D-alanine--D-serine ligase [Enterococcus sp. LJL98]
MKQVAIIFGGISSEYEISLASTASVLETLETMDFDIQKIGIAPTGEWYLVNCVIQEIREDSWQNTTHIQALTPHFNGAGFWLEEEQRYLKPAILFPVLHGGDGEDGSIQGLFEMMQLPYVGCGIVASALCMNKWLLHQLAEGIGIKSTPTFCLSRTDKKEEALKQFITTHTFPFFVKPNEAGSSKGITKIETYDDLAPALIEAFQYGPEVIIQEGVKGIEIGCGILGNTEELIIGECDEISLEEGFFDYTEKYQMVTAKIQVPANIPVTISDEIKRQGEVLYRILGCRGLSRMDFFLTDTGEILLNEVNTLPGFTSHSRYPGMLAAVGVTYPELLEKLILLGEEAYHG